MLDIEVLAKVEDFRSFSENKCIFNINDPFLAIIVKIPATSGKKV